MPLTNEEFEALKNSKNQTEWADLCDKIKHARSGGYPSDWYVKIIMSGLAMKTKASWQK